ncbi:DUF4249 domain-containing protein [bacterium]|nr:DUF4249 domain-containing protein [bacterium]MBU1636854.1 DUF4249 domain-containing protein [bacterium]MBU1920700.1 DUF4249 domain-containing protein [bacterium]
MKKIYIASILSTLLALSFTSCDSEPEENFVEKIVVQGTMYTGLPMQVDLAKSLYWNLYYDQDAQRLTGAIVRMIVDDGTEYELTEENSGIPGTYKAAADAPMVEQGSKYDLYAEHDGRVVTATTTAVAEFSFDWISLPRNDPNNPDTLMFGVDSLGLAVLWTDNPVNFGYAFLFENLEPDWFEDYRQASDNLGKAESPLSAWVVQDREDLLIPWVALLITGNYRFRMYSCDPALWNYFGTVAVNSADNEPVSNVEGGLGVFCAVGADTAYFYLDSQLGPQ